MTTFSPIDFLKLLIETPSFSREEHNTRKLFENLFISKEIAYEALENNIWAKNKYFDKTKPTLLLNSHHDTVKPNPSYTRDPFEARIENGKLYGLGSNDAGGALVSLLAAFLHYYDHESLPYNLIFAASAEEEISGKQGMELLVKHLPSIDLAIVGEPTHMNLAIAEKGLLVLDCVAKGEAGHAARDEGLNAIYEAIEDINRLKAYRFPKVSKTLGEVHISVTMIKAGTQHNVVPDECNFVVDVRVTEQYTLEEVVETIRKNISSDVKPRSVRLQPSGISPEHPIVKRGLEMGLSTFGSPTLSDQALMPFTSIKIGPGDSARSHTADEYIYVNEIEEAVKQYILLLDNLKI